MGYDVVQPGDRRSQVPQEEFGLVVPEAVADHGAQAGEIGQATLSVELGPSGLAASEADLERRPPPSRRDEGLVGWGCYDA